MDTVGEILNTVKFYATEAILSPNPKTDECINSPTGWLNPYTCLDKLLADLGLTYWRERIGVCVIDKRPSSRLNGATIEQVPNKPLLVKGEIIMEVTIQLPDDIAAQLQERGMDLPRVALEKIAIEGARSGELTDEQLRRLLGERNSYASRCFSKVSRGLLRLYRVRLGDG